VGPDRGFGCPHRPLRSLLRGAPRRAPGHSRAGVRSGDKAEMIWAGPRQPTRPLVVGGGPLLGVCLAVEQAEHGESDRGERPMT
jgi:hypothetical protein